MSEGGKKAGRRAYRSVKIGGRDDASDGVPGSDQVRGRVDLLRTRDEARDNRPRTGGVLGQVLSVGDVSARRQGAGHVLHRSGGTLDVGRCWCRAKG